MSISTTLINRADIRFQEAASPLRRYVGCLWTVTADYGATIRVVRDGTTAISIELRKGTYSDWLLRGPLLRPDERRFTVPTTMIGVRLRPGVAFMLSGIAAHSMVDRRISLRRCQAFRDLASIDLSEHTPSQCIETLQGFLINRLENSSVDY